MQYENRPGLPSVAMSISLGRAPPRFVMISCKARPIELFALDTFPKTPAPLANPNELLTFPLTRIIGVAELVVA